MARIKITDLPKDAKITKEELKRVKGGALVLDSSLTLAYKLESNTTFIKGEIDSSVAIAGVDTFGKF
jgi:hypothetical protein